LVAYLSFSWVHSQFEIQRSVAAVGDVGRRRGRRSADGPGAAGATPGSSVQRRQHKGKTENDFLGSHREKSCRSRLVLFLRDLKKRSTWMFRNQLHHFDCSVSCYDPNILIPFPITNHGRPSKTTGKEMLTQKKIRVGVMTHESRKSLIAMSLPHPSCGGHDPPVREAP